MQVQADDLGDGMYTLDYINVIRVLPQYAETDVFDTVKETLIRELIELNNIACVVDHVKNILTF